MDSCESILKMERLVFDRIEFARKGFANNEKFRYQLGIDIGRNDEENMYRVSVSISGEKQNEYSLFVKLSGFFCVEGGKEVSEDMKNGLMSKNAVAIMLPYLRNQVSVLTSQPYTESAVLPLLNVQSLFENMHKVRKEEEKDNE